MTSPTSTPAPVGRPRLAVVAATFTLAGLLAACSSPGPASGAPEPAIGEVQFTSDTGLLTINVPEEWPESTSAAREAFRGLLPPTTTIELAWDLDGDPFLGGSFVMVLAHSHVTGDTDALADQTFATFLGTFGEASVAFDGDFITHTGLEFRRLDVDFTASGVDLYQIELINAVDGRGLEVTITLGGDDVAWKDEALDAVRSLTIR